MAKISSAVSDIQTMEMPIIMRSVKAAYKGSNLCVLFAEAPDNPNNWQGIVLSHEPINDEQQYSIGFTSQHWDHPKCVASWEVFHGTIAVVQE